MTVKEITLEDTLVTLSEEEFSLAPEGSKTITYTHTVTQADVDEGKIDNIVKANGKDPKGNEVDEVTASATVTTVKADPKLTVEKSASPESGVAVGDTVTYTVVVTNSGNVTVSGITLSDKLMAAADVPEAFDLAPEGTKTIEYTYTVTQEDVDAGRIENTATATGTDPKGEDVDAEDSVTITTEEAKATLSVTKEAEPTEGVAVGDKITYTVVVTNTGNVSVEEGTLKDDHVNLSDETFNLAPTETAQFEYTYTVTQADVDAGEIVNVVKANAKAVRGEDPEETEATATVTTEAAKAELSVTKSADPTQKVGVGDTVTYTIVIKNTGNVTVNNGTLDDTLVDLSDKSFELAPGEEATFTYTYEVKQSDVEKGEIENTVKANAKAVRGSDPEEAEATATVTTKGIMTLDAEGYEGTYDAEEHFVSATPSVTDNTKIEYSTDGGQTWTEEVPSVKDVDEIEVIVRATNPDYEPVEETVTLTITPAEVTVTAKNSNKEFGTADPKFEATVSGVVDDFEIEYKVTRPGAGTDEAVGTYPGAIVPDGEEYQGNYKVTYVNGDFEITPAGTLTVSATGYTGVYDGKSHEADAVASITENTKIEYSVDGGQNWTTEPPSIKNVGDRDVLVRATNPDYDPAEATCTLKVTPKPVVIKTGSATKVYDGKALKNKKATITGLIKGESVDLKATGARTAVGSNANTYSIKWTNADKNNYTVTEKLGQLKVTPAPGPGPGPGPAPGPTVATVTPVPQAPVVIDEPEPPTTIIDEPTPQAPVAVWALINLLCAIATALLSLIMLIRYFGKRREEDEETGEETEIKRKGGWRISSLIPAIGAIIAFILTEDMSNPMVMVDKWTLLMVIILAIQVGVAIMAKKKEDDEDDDEYAEA